MNVKSIGTFVRTVPRPRLELHPVLLRLDRRSTTSKVLESKLKDSHSQLERYPQEADSCGAIAFAHAKE